MSAFWCVYFSVENDIQISGYCKGITDVSHQVQIAPTVTPRVQFHFAQKRFKLGRVGRTAGALNSGRNVTPTNGWGDFKTPQTFISLRWDNSPQSYKILQGFGEEEEEKKKKKKKKKKRFPPNRKSYQKIWKAMESRCAMTIAFFVIAFCLLLLLIDFC